MQTEQLSDVIDREQVQALRGEALAQGALAWVEICDRALAGSVPDWASCVDAICGLDWPWSAMQ